MREWASHEMMFCLAVFRLPANILNIPVAMATLLTASIGLTLLTW